MTRAKGGDWGWQKRSDFKKEFSEPLFALKKGEVSDAIILPEGASSFTPKTGSSRAFSRSTKCATRSSACSLQQMRPQQPGALARTPPPQRLREALLSR